MSDATHVREARGTAEETDTGQDPLTVSKDGISTDTQSNETLRTPALASSGVDQRLSALRESSTNLAKLATSIVPAPERAPLFDDLPEASIPGNVHLTSDDSLRRLIGSNGALNLVRQMAKDLADRDSQITEMRKRFEDREKRLKHMLFDSGVSRSDVERRLASLLHRQPSRDSILSGRPGSHYSYVETLDGQLQDAMAVTNDTGDFDGDVNRPASMETPKAKRSGCPSKPGGISVEESSRPRSQSRAASPDGHKRRGSVFSRWSAGLFGWDRDLQGSESHEGRQIDHTRRPSSLTHVTPTTRASSSVRARGKSSASSRTQFTESPLSVKDTQSDLSPYSGRKESSSDELVRRTGLWPTPLGPPHFRAIQAAKTTRPVNLDAGTSEGWLVYKRASSTIASLAWELVFERGSLIMSEDKGDQHMAGNVTISNGARDMQDMHSRLRAISHAKASDSWLPPAFRDTAQSVLPSSITVQPFSEQDSTMELKTFIPEQDQPPTMLPSWTDDPSASSSQVLTDRYGFKLYNERSKRRTRSEKPTSDAGDHSANHTSDHDERSHSQADATSSQRSMKSASLLTPDSLSGEVSLGDGGLKNLSVAGGVHRTPRPLSPETTLNKTGAIFSNEKSSARLHMLSQLDIYGADKAKQELWDVFLRKTKEDRQKVVSKDFYHFDQNDDELIGLASMGTGKMAKERRRELNILIHGGIPMSYRPKIWGEMTGAYVMKEPAYYQELLGNDRDVDRVCVEQIDLDLKRTMPSNIFFAGTGPGVPKLRRVLLAFSRHNVAIGYCQGMNVIAATLLLTHPTEEDAFFVLACIVENILPARYFTPDLLTSRADQVVLNRIVKELCPKIQKHFDTLSIDLEAITFGWFLSVFTDCLPAELLFRTWDIFFIEGHEYLFCVAIAILKLHEKGLLACDSPGEVYALLKELKQTKEIHIDDFVRSTERVSTSMRSKNFNILYVFRGILRLES